jgi:hypothetical protein
MTQAVEPLKTTNSPWISWAFADAPDGKNSGTVPGFFPYVEIFEIAKQLVTIIQLRLKRIK